MENYQTYQDAIKTAENSAGTTAAKYEAQMESIETAINRLTTAWEEFTQKLGQSGVLKGFIYTAQGLLKFLDRITALTMNLVSANLGYKISKMSIGKIGTAVGSTLFGHKFDSKNNTNNIVSGGFKGVKQWLEKIYNAVLRKKDGKSADNEDPKGKAQNTEKSNKIGAAVLSGVSSALTGIAMGPNNSIIGLFGGYKTKDISVDDVESNTPDRIITGVASGVLSGVGTYFLGPIGGMLGNVIGNEFGTFMKWLNHRDEIDRKQRVQDALKVIDAINKAQESVKKINEQVSKRGSSDFDAIATQESIYATLNALYEADNGYEVIEDFKQRVGEALGITGKDANYYLGLLVTGTDEQAEKVNRILSATLSLNEAFQTYASQEETRYTNSQKVEEARKVAEKYGLNTVGGAEELLAELQKKYNTEFSSLTEDQRGELSEYITKLQQVITDRAEMAQNVNKSAFESAITMSGVEGWNAIDMAGKSLDEAIIRIVDQVEESGADIGINLREYNGEITEEAKNLAISALKNSGLGDLFKRDTNPLFRLLSDKAQRDNISQILKPFDQLVSEIKKADPADLNKIFKNLTEDQKSALGVDTADALRTLVLNLDSSSAELTSFSRAINISEDDLSNHSELFDVALQDLTKSVSETIESMNQMTNYIDSIISAGGMSVSTLQEIIKKSPKLLYKMLEDGTVSIDTSIENIFNNIWNKVMGIQGSELLTTATIEGQLGDANFIQAFKDSLEAAGKDSTYLAGRSNLKDALDDIRSRGDLDILNVLLSSTMNAQDIENSKKILAQLSTYQTKVIDNQISNLNSQKEALSKVNDEYKKQIDLIKAQQALENAKKEKRRVYRAGVGWTYEADQEAIQKAQEELNEKDTQIKEENLQYQIDLLEKEKDILNNLPSEMTLQKQKELFEVFENNLVAGGVSVNNFVMAIQGAYDKLNNLQSPNVSDYTGTNPTVKKALAGLDKFSEPENLSSFTSGGEWSKNGEILDGDRLSAAKSDARLVGKSLSDYLTSMGYEKQNEGAFNSSYEKGTSNWHKDRESYNTFLSSLIGSGEVPGLFSELDVANWQDNGVAKSASELNKRYGLTGDNVLDQETVNKFVSLYNIYGGNKHSLVVDPGYKYDTATGNYEANNLIYKPGLRANQMGHIKKLDLINGKFSFIDDENAGKLYFQSLDEATKLEPIEAKIAEKMTNEEPRSIVIKKGVGMFYKVADDDWRRIAKISYGNGGEIYDASKIEEMLPTNAKGAYDFAGGSSLINELGTEGIVTPQGTITALPAHTGIVPADLTRNLYQLGELSPNLIKGLSSVKTEANRFNSTEDNSMFVNTLNATFNADSDFDFNKLLSDARQYMAVTRHNK